MKRRLAADLRRIWTEGRDGWLRAVKGRERGAKVAYQRRLQQITCSTVKMASELFSFFFPVVEKLFGHLLKHLC